jgi:predicted glycoside hydrolase/deacetylase ChbG (UPF0249 family)
MKTLIVNADDFGLAPSVNQGILDAHLAGSVTSTTLMVNMPAAAQAAVIAKAHPALGVGLHFNLTLGWPLAEAASVESLVGPDGRFHSRGALAARLFTGRVRRDDVARELQAQYRAFLALGIRPTHVDSHQHVHGFPAVFDVVAEICEAEGIPTRMPWLLKLEDSRPSLGRTLRQWVLGRMLRRNVREWRGRVLWNSGMGSLFDVGDIPVKPTLDDYKRVLAAAGEGVFELMVHPVPDADAVRGLTRIGHVSAAEWQVLSKPGLGQLAADLGFRLASFSSAFRQ